MAFTELHAFKPQRQDSAVVFTKSSIYLLDLDRWHWWRSGASRSSSSVIGPEGSAVFPSLSVLASCLTEGASLPRVSYLSPQDLKGTPRQLCLGLCILEVCPWKMLSSCGTWASAGSVLLRKASNFYSSQNAPKIGTMMYIAGKSLYMESPKESEIEHCKTASRRLHRELLL